MVVSQLDDVMMFQEWILFLLLLLCLSTIRPLKMFMFLLWDVFCASWTTGDVSTAVVVFCNGSPIEDASVVVVFCASWTTGDVSVVVGGAALFCNGSMIDDFSTAIVFCTSSTFDDGPVSIVKICS